MFVIYHNLCRWTESPGTLSAAFIGIVNGLCRNRWLDGEEGGDAYFNNSLKKVAHRLKKNKWLYCCGSISGLMFTRSVRLRALLSAVAEGSFRE